MNILADLIAKFFQLYVPVHRSAIRALNQLINTALQTNDKDITDMDNTEAITIIRGAVAAILTSRTALAAAIAELEAFRDSVTDNAALVASLTTQVNALTAADAEIDAELAPLRDAITPPAEVPPAEAVAE
jgi:hypothetical protein